MCYLAGTIYKTQAKKLERDSSQPLEVSFKDLWVSMGQVTTGT